MSDESSLRDSDGALVLGKGEGALVTKGDGEDLSMYVPQSMMERERMPRAMVYLAALLVRFHQDPDFVEEQIEWFRTKRN